MHRWKDEGKCLGMDTNIFFDKYESDPALARAVDKMCQACPVNRMCLASAVSTNQWGVWGGIYLKDGKIDKEFNAHKTKQDWFDTWQAITMESE